MKIIDKIKKKERQLYAVLIDPDRLFQENLQKIIDYGRRGMYDFIFIGGSLVNNSTEDVISQIKSEINIPVILFPGNPSQFSEKADAILFLSLISGRNPEFLIGHHVNSAQKIKKSNIEVIPTGYILIQSDKVSSTEYITNTKPIPANKPEIVVSTALAGELLGMKLIYIEGGSGASNSVNQKIITEVKKNVSLPIIVGGGIKNTEDFKMVAQSGADLIVVGTAIEQNPDLIPNFYKILNKLD